MAIFLPSSISTIVQLIQKIQENIPSSSCSESLSHAFMKDIKYLGKMFHRIQAVLKDAEERDIQDESMKLWLSELKDVAYDAEDVLDEFHYEVLRAQVESRAATDDAKLLDNMEQVKKKRKVSVSLTTANTNHLDLMKVLIESNMQERIKDIKERLGEISEARKDFWIGDEHGKRRYNARVTYSPTPTTHEVKSDHVYGRNTEKEEVIEFLLSENNHKLSVVAIIGVGGIGKTTLAQLVYNDHKISEHFDKRIWIYVYENFDVVRIARATVEELMKCSCSINELSQLKQKLDQELKGKKLLLVLDDVWNERLSPWECLEDLLAGANIVRILVTTRNESVTKVMKTVILYRLTKLPEIECLQLFQTHAFTERDPSELPSLVEIERKL